MIRLARLVFGIAVGILELLMVYAFICMLPKWLPAQEARYHPASDAAAISLQQRHERVSGTARPPAQ